MPKKEAVPVAPMRVLKIGNTPSLSGRSQLTYHVGCNAESAIHIRVVDNSSSGQFNPDWIPLSLLEKLLSEHPTTKPLTSVALRNAFKHRSSNSPAFLFAALKAELIVLSSSDKDAGYTIGDTTVFRHEMNVLIASDSSIDDTADKPARKKPVGRKPSGRPAL